MMLCGYRAFIDHIYTYLFSIRLLSYLQSSFYKNLGTFQLISSQNTPTLINLGHLGHSYPLLSHDESYHRHHNPSVLRRRQYQALYSVNSVSLNCYQFEASVFCHRINYFSMSSYCFYRKTFPPKFVRKYWRTSSDLWIAVYKALFFEDNTE